MKHKYAIIATPGSRDFAYRVYSHLDPDEFCFIDVSVKTFANKELKPRVMESVRRKEGYLFHDFGNDPNIGFMELLLTGDALHRAGIASLQYELPSMPYLRQDRKDRDKKTGNDRVPLSAALCASLLETNRSLRGITTLDMHASQIEGCYSIPVCNISANLTVFKEYIHDHFHDLDNIQPVSPDASGAERTRNLAQVSGIRRSVGLMDKRREADNESEVLHYVGDYWDGMDVMLNDDMIDTAGSLIHAKDTLATKGARDFYAVATHAVFSPKGGTTAEHKLRNSGIKVITTESIQRPSQYATENKDWLTILPLDKLFAKLVLADATGDSVTELQRTY
jgi:ribose-phosphate pyrophosphokinase